MSTSPFGSCRTAPAAPGPSTSDRRPAPGRSTACRRRSTPTRCRSSRRRGSRRARRTARPALPPRSRVAGSPTNRNSLSRVFITPSDLRSPTKWPGDPHHHCGQAAGIAAEIDDDAVGVPQFVDRLLELRVDGRHPHVEPDDPGGRASRRRAFPLSRPARTSSAGCPTVTGFPCSGRRSSDNVTAAPSPFSNVTSTFDPAGPRRCVCAMRHASDPAAARLVPAGPPSGSTRSRSATLRGSNPRDPPSRTDQRRRFAVDVRDDQLAADEPDFEVPDRRWYRPTSRPAWTRPRRTGISAKCDSAEAAQHVADRRRGARRQTSPPPRAA